MSGDNSVAPIIIKKKKVSGGDGHHGGAWKVAYADFVTAMMAFFMLMWLLNATTEKQRKGIADYFSPTIPINRISGGGDGAFGGDSVFTEESLPQNGISATASLQAQGSSGLEDGGADDGDGDQELRMIEEALMGIGGESYVDEDVYKHIITRVTDEGLVVELFESETGRLFEGTDQPTELLNVLMDLISEAAGLIKNQIAIEGHVQTSPIVLAMDPSWDNSAARAQKVRKMVEDRAVPSTRIQRVTGHANREPIADNPMSLRNSRIEVIFLR